MDTITQDRIPTAKVISAARERAELTQKELAERVGVTAAVISAYETGRHEPSVANLQRILNACGYELRLDFALPGEKGVLERRARFKHIMKLRAEAHAEAERLHGKPRVMPGFQDAALRAHKEYIESIKGNKAG